MGKWKNANGTSRFYPDETWKKYWEEKSDFAWPHYCQVKGCINRAEVGAHIKEVGSSNKLWILPMCRQHNGQSSERTFDIDNSYMLVRANQSEN